MVPFVDEAVAGKSALAIFGKQFLLKQSILGGTENWKLKPIVPAYCTCKKLYFQEKYTKHTVYELKFISFYEIEKDNNADDSWKEFIHSTIDYNILCCSFISIFIILFLVFFFICPSLSLFIGVMNFNWWSFIFLVQSMRPLCERFSKQIENKLKNSLCTFAILFHSHFWFDFNSLKWQKSNG